MYENDGQTLTGKSLNIYSSPVIVIIIIFVVVLCGTIFVSRIENRLYRTWPIGLTAGFRKR